MFWNDEVKKAEKLLAEFQKTSDVISEHMKDLVGLKRDREKAQAELDDRLAKQTLDSPLEVGGVTKAAGSGLRFVTGESKRRS